MNRLRNRPGGRSWAGQALTLGQLALMATNLVLSLSVAYAGDLAAIGAVAPAMLVFQLACGVLQRSLAEATLLSSSHAGQAADLLVCGRSVAAALVGGAVGGAVAFVSSLAVPGVSPALALAYSAGIPFAIALDIGRAAGVAAGAARRVFVETASWLVAQLALMVVLAVVHSPLGVCLASLLVNVVFFLVAAGRPERRPVLRGLVPWVRSQQGAMGAASLDAFLVGLTPVLAMQVAAFLASAATLGVVRVLQQLLAPLTFVSITFRRVLIYRRRADVYTTRWQDLRDGLLAAALMAVGAVLLGAGVLLGRRLLPALAFVPGGLALLLAGVEKGALGLSYGCSLSRFVRGEFRSLLHARYVMLASTMLAVPLLTVSFGAPGYLAGSALGMVAYAVVVLVLPAARPAVVLPVQVPSR